MSQGDCANFAGAASDPVFVLCTSRSGSTLLRFVLDAHPQLGCPPETRIPAVIAQLTTAWAATSALTSPDGGNGEDAAAAGVRHTVDQIVGPYLRMRGKSRYCDKNLGTEQYADVLRRVFPDAKFLCLYRHPMDMIASGVEACPWGLVNYGFEQYAARTPGNTVQALARYWSDHTAAILAVADKYPASCLRIRYEDLVSDAEAVAAEIFGFLGLPLVANIAELAFSRERERSGPGDFKIWNTSEITGESVGHGWTVPASLIPAPLLATVNELAARLGYVPVDDKWGASSRPGDLRLPSSLRQQAGPTAPSLPAAPVHPGILLVGERVQAGLSRLDETFAKNWQPHCEAPFLITVLAPAAGRDMWWLVDPAAVTAVSGYGTCPHTPRWSVTAPVATWEQVIRDGINLGLAFRRHGMRYRDQGDGGAGSALADNRVAMMSDFLGITRWSAAPPSPMAAAPPVLAAPVLAAPVLAAPVLAAPVLAAPVPSELDQPLWSAQPVQLAEILRAVARPGESPREPEQREPEERESKERAAAPHPASSGARIARERIERARILAVRRRRLIRVAAVGATAFVLAAAGFLVTRLDQGHHPVTAASQPKPGYLGPFAPVTLNADNSVTMGQPRVSGPVLDIYEDFQCPACRTFERADGPMIQRLAYEGKVKVIYHPFTVFSAQEQQAGSVRSWAAARCAPSRRWMSFHNVIFAARPPAVTAGGFTVSQLISFGQYAGISGQGFATCVQSQRYASLDAPVSDEIMNSGLPGLPVLRLNGRAVSLSATPASLRQLILSASASAKGPAGTA